jgi:peptidoglycan/xylan/chitin deacetylase (PgdA/CDA1 family)
MGVRDFRGYGGRPPHPQWPGGARVAVSVVLNFEEGAELTISGGDERNEPTHEVVAEVQGFPDPCMESHYEYGTRAAYWRIMDVLERHGVTCTVSSCGRAVAASPWLVQDAHRRGHEISCHGWRWEQHYHMGIDEERSAIGKTVEAITAATGVRPVGWHTKSASSVNTRRLLAREFDFLYDSDAYNDDLPYFVDVEGHRHLVIPYSFDTNDMRFLYGNDRVKLGTEFSAYVIDAFEWLWREGASAPKMMSIGVHLRRTGRPGRIGGLDRVLEHMRERGGVWFAPRRDIARHWIDRFGASGGAL